MFLQTINLAYWCSLGLHLSVVDPGFSVGGWGEAMTHLGCWGHFLVETYVKTKLGPIWGGGTIRTPEVIHFSGN